MRGSAVARRSFLQRGAEGVLGTALLPAPSVRVQACTSSSSGRRSLDLSVISAITDEVGTTEEEAFAFVRQYGLRWIEMRTVPGTGRLYVELPPATLRDFKKRLDGLGLGVSFLNTWMLKWTLPGTSPLRRRQYAEPEWNELCLKDVQRLRERMDYLKRCIEAAHILGVQTIRIFTFWRVADPNPLYPRVAGIVSEMTDLAQREGVRLLVENESACNVATSEELRRFVDLVPSPALGINWDPHNGLPYEPSPFPQGYRLLPRHRIGNVQIKGESLLSPGELLDWRAIMRAMMNDGYRGKFGLETHFGEGRARVRNARASMTEIVKLLEL
jgi:sugar phosphate isomerase/epimerase